MATLQEFKVYIDTEYHLHQRLNELRRLEGKAHRGWVESKGHDVMLKDWTDAIDRANRTDTALMIVRDIIREIDSNYPEFRRALNL